MTLTLHNTLTRRQEPFQPLDPSNVRMYVCGPTVYDRAHIGNARPVVVFDVLYRLLRHMYGADHVTYARNITDVDDKIMAAARERGIAIDQLTAETTAMYHEDMAALGALPPDIEPRATQHIAQMVRMIGELIESGHAYAADGHVLFHVPSMKDYGKLSRRSLKEMIAGARVEVAPYKKDPADFVLWKPSAADQPGWDSPWGRGRPGWHIECSAMSEAHLGETFDIHGGGLDLIFPHHENEIAQSTCAHRGREFVRVWLHNGFLSVNGEKMSKSLGNFFTVRDLLAKAPGEAIRACLLSAHYRAPLDWTDEALSNARQGLDRLYGALRQASPGPVAKEIPAGVLAALDDDLNTPKAVAELHELAGRINKAPEAERAGLASSLRAGGAVLGLLQADPETWFKWQPEGGAGLTDAAIDDLIARRAEAKKSRNFADADRIRDELKQNGVVLEDSSKGTTWKRVR
ncbi:MAG TPA: cysteine--tRNA ligase [Alphaproteobacteria bacterium]|nr:cysteine--tRNA ligase [Alphaproteobacteria bacterium]